MNAWKLHVEGLGKIEKADVEVGPFTMFVGDNNSGKSYLMTLIWGIRENILSDIWINDDGEEKFLQILKMASYRKYVKCIDDIAEHLLEGENELALSDDFFISINELWNQIMDVYRNDLVKRLFGSNQIKVKSINLEMKTPLYKNLSKSWVKKNYDDLISLIIIIGIYNKKDQIEETTVKMDKTYSHIFALIVKNLLQDSENISENGKNVYFPTSRTGFVLTYKMLIDYVLRPSMNENLIRNLTMPCIDFIQCINWISQDMDSNRYQDLIVFMNESIISGNISVGTSNSTEFFYTPVEDQKQLLPMKLCSGVVTEVALVIMFLKYLGLSSITIEEPEMCLHPKLQWQYARAFIKMYNSGLPICMATHSDIFMAQVNNMIKLNSHPDKDNLMKQYGYEKNDLISAKDVKVYEFHVKKDGYTDIIEIKADEDGFQIPSFQKALRELLNQSMDFEMEE